MVENTRLHRFLVERQITRLDQLQDIPIWAKFISGLAEKYDKFGLLRGIASQNDFLIFVFDDGLVTVTYDRQIVCDTPINFFG